MIMEKRVFTRISAIVFWLFSGFALTACGGSDDPVVPINIPTEDDECCNAEETFLAYTFLHNGYLKEIESLRDTIDEKYALSVYSRGGKLHAGYNDVAIDLLDDVWTICGTQEGKFVVPYLANCYLRKNDMENFLMYLKLAPFCDREATRILFRDRFPDIDPEDYYAYAYKEVHGAFPKDYNDLPF